MSRYQRLTILVRVEERKLQGRKKIAYISGDAITLALAGRCSYDREVDLGGRIYRLWSEDGHRELNDIRPEKNGGCGQDLE